jgi:cytochrome c oxidase subunit 4
MSEYIVPKSIYYRVFFALMVLLAITIAASYVHLGRLNIFLALTVSVAKMLLIVLYFMHIRYSSRLSWVVASAGVFWLGILFVLALADYLTRGLLPVPTGWE